MRLDDPSKHAGLTSSAKRSEERPPFGVGLVWAAVSAGLAQVASPGEGRGRGQQPPSRDESPSCRTRWSLVRLMGRGSVCGGGGSRRGREGRGGGGGVKGRVRGIHLFIYCLEKIFALLSFPCLGIAWSVGGGGCEFLQACKPHPDSGLGSVLMLRAVRRLRRAPENTFFQGRVRICGQACPREGPGCFCRKPTIPRFSTTSRAGETPRTRTPGAASLA